MEDADDEELLNEEGDDWVATHTSNRNNIDEMDEISKQVTTMSLRTNKKKDNTTNNKNNNANNNFNNIDHQEEEDNDDDDEIIDINDYNEEDLEDEDNDNTTLQTTAANIADDSILHTRTYDISITYDKYYQTPRVWLFGYDENGSPLDPQKILEDIHTDYSNKTVTIEQHPHLSTAHASIHPCRHAEVMKKMVDRMSEEGKYIRVDLYLYIFLKVISSVIPTIDYDQTIQIDAPAQKPS